MLRVAASLKHLESWPALGVENRNKLTRCGCSHRQGQTGYSGEGEHRFRREAERHSGRRAKLFAFPPESRSPSHRNAVRNHNGMAFSFRPESCSPSTGFPSFVVATDLLRFRQDCGACERSRKQLDRDPRKKLLTSLFFL